jgi:hypothetical protein
VIEVGPGTFEAVRGKRRLFPWPAAMSATDETVVGSGVGYRVVEKQEAS